jgi:DNA invertase Pin-like site-specific DNA recombinase
METERLHHSLSAQVSYYSDLIQRNPEWEYAGVYADDGITGTKANSREEFQRMLEDCEAGKIDIVLTKSISRFARNTVDLLETVRHLKELGVSVRFEKENIDSLSGDGEVMLTLLASFAQEEITSLSNNVKWGIRKRFEKGIPNFRNKILGYEWEDDHLVVVPEEAAIRDGAARDRATRQGKEIPQRSPRLLQQDQMRRVRLLVRLKGLALQQQIPEGHLALQPQVRRRQDLPHTAPDGRGDSGRLP